MYILFSLNGKVFYGRCNLHFLACFGKQGSKFTKHWRFGGWHGAESTICMIDIHIFHFLLMSPYLLAWFSDIRGCLQSFASLPKQRDREQPRTSENQATDLPKVKKYTMNKFWRFLNVIVWHKTFPLAILCHLMSCNLYDYIGDGGTYQLRRCFKIRIQEKSLIPLRK